MKRNRSQHDEDGGSSSVPSIWMARSVFCRIMMTIGARAPETGGILLGPIGCDDVTDYYFDITASCTAGTYSPDHVTLGKLMKQQWLPSGIDMKGFVHSHPCGFDTLSSGDLRYIARLLEKNPDMSQFAAPILIPEQHRMRAIVVLRDQPHTAHVTSLRFF